MTAYTYETPCQACGRVYLLRRPGQIVRCERDNP